VKLEEKGDHGRGKWKAEWLLRSTEVVERMGFD
jgi:hypothetical protein